jgi:hypothetical protein
MNGKSVNLSSGKCFLTNHWYPVFTNYYFDDKLRKMLLIFVHMLTHGKVYIPLWIGMYAVVYALRQVDHLFRELLPDVCVCVWTINLYSEMA